MWLDARHLGAAFWEKRFPTILATARSHGVDPVTELIPVAPAQHYASGGVRTDLWGRSDVPGLYATGEVACSGVHGANRLASNSLLEGLVFSRRIADVLPGELRPWADPAADTRPESLVAAERRHEIQTAMTDLVGVLRTADGMAEAAARLAELVAGDDGLLGTRAWETSNVAAISVSLTAAAALREETRGSHWREDFPDRDDAHWAGHVDVRLTGRRPRPRLRPGRRDRPRAQPDRKPPRMSTPPGIVATPYADLPAALVEELAAAGLDPEAVYAAVVAALAEDLPGDRGDVTSRATIGADARGSAVFAAREPGVVAGLGVAALVFTYVLGHEVLVADRVADGTRVAAGDVVMRVEGPIRGLLCAERTALNFASHLSGVATATAHWVDALAGTRARVLDTRKTLPGWRALQKYAVRCGGGVNHRFSLSDMAMVKDNHVIAAGGVLPAYAAVREQYPDVPVEVEVTDLDQLRAAARRRLRPDPARQHGHRDDGRGGPHHRRAGPPSRRPEG